MYAVRERAGMKFLGSYTYQLDDKGRVSLPAAYRREAPDQRFVLVQAYPPALTLYPEKAWSGVEERLTDLMSAEPDARRYLLKLMANAEEVVPDAQGRILIPARLREAAELGSQVVLVGMIDKVDIWNPARYEAEVADVAGDFEKYRRQIFR